MNLNDIQKHIDRVVGTEGTLRIPAWWMHKILSDLLQYCEGMDDSKAVEKLEQSITALSGELTLIGNRVQSLELRKFIQVSRDLPSEPQENVIYLQPVGSSENFHNLFIEWVYIRDRNHWEKFGEFKADVDLSEYAKKTELDALAQKVAALEEIINQITVESEE